METRSVLSGSGYSHARVKRGCREVFDEYYFVPKIIRIIDTEENMVY